MPREPGTPGRRASEGEGGDGARPEAAGPRAAHGGEDAELGRAWAALGRRPHNCAARVLSRVRRPRPAPARPEPEPTGRAGRLRGGRPSVRHGLCALAFPPPSSSRPQWRRRLRVSSSGARGPAPRTEAASRAAAPPFSRAGDGRERGGEAEQRKRGGGPGPARGGGSFCLTGRGGNSATAPAARGAEAARRRRRRGRGGLPRGRPNRPQPGEGRREPVSARGVDAADVGGGGRAAGGPPPTHPAGEARPPPRARDPARPPPPRPIEFLCTALIGAKRLFGCSPDLQAAGISFQPRRSDSL